jgi:hypothetical protein
MADKRIALILSGKSRSGMFCFPYIYDAFLNNNYNVDVFVHTWDDYRVLDLYKPKQILIERNEQEILEYLFRQLTLSNTMSFEGRIDNVLLMYYSLKRSFDIIDEPYDYVIRSRFDVIIQDKFNIEPIITELEEDKYDIFIPDEVFNFGGYQDRVAIGKFEAMKTYCDTIVNINSIATSINRWHPETFLKHQLDSEQIRVMQRDINHRLVRSSSVVTNWPENPFKFLDL